MPLNTPTLAQLRQQRRGDIAVRLPGADVTLRRATLPILADADARGQFDVLNALRGWYAEQFLVESCAAEYLDRVASRYGIARLGATFAAGNAIFSGTDGIAVPIATPLQTSDGAVQFTTQAAGTIASGSATIAIEAATAGSAANLAAGAPITISTAIAGVIPTAVVDGSGLSGGTDAETDDALRARVLARIRQPPQGGAASDYIAWAKTVPGVTRAWCYPLLDGLGTVGVTFVMDGRTDNIPLTADIDAVQAAIDALRPVTAGLRVFAPTADALSITVHALTPTSAALQAAVTAELEALARTVAPGGATVGDGVSASDPGGYLYLSQIDAAVQAAGGVVHFDLAAPIADVTYASGHLPATPTVIFT